MNVLGSVIARIGSKRLTYKNLLPYKGTPLVLHALKKMINSNCFDQIVLSTDSELIARTCTEIDNVSILRRPSALSGDETPSVPVFQHIVENFSCDVHVNYNCNFPECPDQVFNEAINLALQEGESLSVPYAVWAQTPECLNNYGNPLEIRAKTFDSDDIFPVDIHTMDDLMQTHKAHQNSFNW